MPRTSNRSTRLTKNRSAVQTHKSVVHDALTALAQIANDSNAPASARVAAAGKIVDFFSEEAKDLGGSRDKPASEKSLEEIERELSEN